MAAISIHVEGVARVLAALDQLSPARNPKFVGDFLYSVAFAISTKAKRETIIRGGGMKAPVHPTRITSRTGKGRDSIAVDADNSPVSVSVGTNVGYMLLHEFGGDVSVRGSIVASHTRKIAFGKRRKPFTVPSYYRSAHGATYPARPWLRPAVELVEPQIEAMLERAMQAALV